MPCSWTLAASPLSRSTCCTHHELVQCNFSWCTCLRTHVHTYTHMRTHMHMDMRMHTHVHAHMHMHTYMHMHKHTHVHMPARPHQNICWIVCSTHWRM